MLTAPDIGRELSGLIHETVTEVMRGNGAQAPVEDPGTLANFGCPDCGGVLRETSDGDYLHYRCRTGHSFSPQSLLNAEDEEFERALWMAVRTLDEQAELLGRMAARQVIAKNQWLSNRFRQRRDVAIQGAQSIRKMLLETIRQRTELNEP